VALFVPQIMENTRILNGLAWNLLYILATGTCLSCQRIGRFKVAGRDA
jgi:hypothetical protein